MNFQARVTLLVFGLTAAIVLIAGWVIHQLTEEDIRNRLDAKLTWQVAAISQPETITSILVMERFLYLNRSMNDTRQSMGKKFDMQIPFRIFIDEEVILYTEGFPEFPLESLDDGFSTIQENGEDWRLLTRTFNTPISLSVMNLLFTGGTNLTIQAATSRDSVSTTMEDFQRRFISVGIIAVIVAGIGAWLLTGTVLSPLSRLRKHSENVNDSGDLSERIPENLGPNEVVILAKSLNAMLSRLEISAQKTENALDSSRAFASNVAHELRTPLTSMRMNLELLDRYESMAADERAAIITDLINQEDRLLNTLESLRLLARGDLSEDDVFEEIDFAQLIQDVVTRQKNQQKDIDIQLHLPTPPPLIFGWREGLIVLFRNVVENSVVHSMLSDNELKIDIYSEVEGKYVNIIIDDNGVGISEAEIPYVMGRFNRGTNSQIPGSGLGLPLVKQQAELHGGSVSLGISPDKGTRVTISLPIVR